MLLKKLVPESTIQLSSCLNDFSNPCVAETYHLAIIDEALKTQDVTECVKQLRNLKQDLKLVVLGDNSKLAALPLMMCGANGYLEKSAEDFELSRAIDVIMNGGSYLPQRLVLHLMEAEKSSKGFQRRLELLTPNEKLLLYELSKGGTLSQIGARTNKAITTLSTQKRRLMQKLRVATNHELLTLIRDMDAENFS